MKINRQKLLDVLDKVKPGLANKEIIEQTNCFVFKDKQVFTYNDEIAVSHPLKIGFEGAVNADPFFAVLNKIKQDEIDIVLKDNQIIIKGTKIKSGIPLLADIVIPEVEIDENIKWHDISDDFSDALKACLFSVSQDMTRPVLTCLHVKNKFIESTDGFRFSRYVTENKLPEILIPVFAAKALLAYTIKDIATDGSWLFFRCVGGVLFSCRTYENDYPELTPFMDAEFTEIKLPKNLLDVLDRCQIFTEKSTQSDGYVDISFDKGEMSVRSQQEGLGWITEKMKVRFQDTLSFKINPYLLQDVLVNLNKTSIDEETKCIKFEGKNLIHMIMLGAV